MAAIVRNAWTVGSGFMPYVPIAKPRLGGSAAARSANAAPSQVKASRLRIGCMAPTTILDQRLPSNAMVSGMKSMFCAGAALAALAFAAPIRGQSIRIVKFSEGKPFQMGKVTSRSIVHPDLGAKRLTLNYSASENGSEFS